MIPNALAYVNKSKLMVKCYNKMISTSCCTVWPEKILLFHGSQRNTANSIANIRDTILCHFKKPSEI